MGVPVAPAAAAPDFEGAAATERLSSVMTVFAGGAFLSLSLRAWRAASARDGCASCARTGADETKNHASPATKLNFRSFNFRNSNFRNTVASAASFIRKRLPERVQETQFPTAMLARQIAWRP